MYSVIFSVRVPEETTDLVRHVPVLSLSLFLCCTFCTEVRHSTVQVPHTFPRTLRVPYRYIASPYPIIFSVLVRTTDLVLVLVQYHYSTCTLYLYYSYVLLFLCLLCYCTVPPEPRLPQYCATTTVLESWFTTRLMVSWTIINVVNLYLYSYCCWTVLGIVPKSTCTRTVPFVIFHNNTFTVLYKPKPAARGAPCYFVCLCKMTITL
jgi:hypothetical protein